MAPSLPDFRLNHELHSELLQNTQVHEEVLARIGLTKEGVTQSLEYFSMLRSGLDVTSGYKDYDELRIKR
jgi:hypothetical protein